MSGSGATCFGLFGNRRQAEAAAAAMIDTAPHWWSVPAQIGGSVPAGRKGEQSSSRDVP